MKRKNWKRTAAFVTSLTMATTMMPAELSTVIVRAADANVSAEITKLDWHLTKYDDNSKSYIKSIKVNGSAQTNIIYNDNMKFAAGSSVEITSKVPLDIKFNHDNFRLSFNDFAALQITFDKTTGKFTRTNGLELSKELVLAEMIAYAGYKENDKTFTAKWDTTVNNNVESFNLDGNDTPVVIVSFKAEETEENGQYTYKFTMPDDNGITPTGQDDDNIDTVTVKTSEESVKVNFYESEAARTADKQLGVDVWTATDSEECDKYFKNTVIKSSNEDNVGTYVNENGIINPEKIIVGDTVTVTAKNPFVVHVSDGNNEHSWINATNSFEDDSYKSVFTMPKYEGTKEDQDPDRVVVIDIVKIDENYSYKISGSKLLADADTGSFKNAEAAWIVAKYYDMPTSNLQNADEAAEEIKNKKAEIIAGFGQAGDKGKEIDGAIPNGKFVVVKADRAERITAKVQGINKPFKVTKNGAVVYETNLANNDNAKPDTLADDVTVFGVDGTAGTYNATYTVKGTDGSPYSLNYSFVIKAKDKLTSEDVALTLSAKENNKPVDQDVLAGTQVQNYKDGIMAPGETAKEVGSIKDGDIVTFMLAKGKAEEIAQSGNSKYQFTVAPTIDALMKNEGLDPDKCYVTGTTSGSTLSRVYEFVIHVTDPEYGGSEKNPKDISIKWRVVSYDEIPRWENNRFAITGQDAVTNPALGEIKDAQISIDELDKFDEVLSEASKANDAAKEAVKNGEVRYQWIKAPGANRTFEQQDELDEFEDGLPTELGDYTVYIIYDDVIQATVDVNISLYSLGIYADEADLTFKYGHNFELTKPTVQKDSDGKAIDVEIENLTCSVYKAIEVENKETGTKNWTFAETDLNGNPINPVIDNKSVDKVGQLNAGKYIITFTGKSLDEDYVVKEVPQVLTVNKKTLDDSSIVILIDPFKYDGKTHDVVKERGDNKSNFTVRDTDFEADDPRYNISDLFKITEGGKQSAVGAHDCTFTLVSKVEAVSANQNDIDAADARTALLKNFEGSTKESKWHITAERANELGNPKYDASANVVQVNAGLKWNDDNTTLYDNGRIHLEVTRNADDKINSDKSVAKITKFGVIVDKEGKLEAPLNYGVKYNTTEINKIADPTAKAAAEAEKATAEKFLEVGNGFTEGGYTKTSSPITCASQTYKVNVSVKDVETGVWARPYVLYEDGTVSYGDVRYLDLTNEAITRLKLWTANTNAAGEEKAVRKADLDKYQASSETLIKANVKSGYNTAENKFYVYSRYVDLETAGFTNVAEVADFGIVADRDGEFDAAIAEAVEAAYNTAYQKAYDADYDPAYELAYKNAYNAAIAANKTPAEAEAAGKAAGKAAGEAAVDGKNYQYVAAAEAAKAAAPKAYMKKNLKKETAKVVGHYNKNNKVLNVNEYAASIKLGNAATGCWVRSYIDLGNGLVIYNEPMYIESASDYYGDAVAGQFTTAWEKKKIGEDEFGAPEYDNYNRLVFTHNNSANARKADFVAKAGITGLTEQDVEVVKTGVVADKNNLLVQDNKMILNAGFINGVHKDSYGKAYSGKLTPKDTNDVSVRTYTIFKIKGADKDVEVTVYGSVNTFKYNEVAKRVKNSNGEDFVAYVPQNAQP